MYGTNPTGRGEFIMGGKPSIKDDVEDSPLAPAVYPYRVTADPDFYCGRLDTPGANFHQ
jgi:hypothetical protein